MTATIYFRSLWGAITTLAGTETAPTPQEYNALVAPSGGTHTTLAAALVAGARRIRVAPGTYPATNVTISQAGTIIEGAGQDAVTLVAGAGSCITVAAADVIIRGVKLDGNRPAQSGTSAIIGMAGGADRCLIEDVTLLNGAYNGFAIRNSGSHDVVTRRATIIGPATDPAMLSQSFNGIYHIGHVERPVVEDCYITGTTQAIGYWYGVRGGRIEHNIVVDNYGWLTGVGGASDSRSAIEVYGADAHETHTDNWVIGNYVDGSTAGCIELAAGSPRTRIIGNYMINHGASGYGSPVGIVASTLQPSTDCVIAHNTIVCNGPRTVVRSGPFIEGAGTDGAILEKNTIIGANYEAPGAVAYGLRTDAQGANGVKIRDNVFDGCLDILIQNLGPRSEVSGNRMINLPADITTRRGTSGAIFRTDSTCTGVTVARNIIATPLVGVTAFGFDGSQMVIEGNEASVDVTQSNLMASDSILRGNRLTTTTFVGQVLYVGGNRNIVEANILLAPAGVARSIYVAGNNNVVGHNVAPDGVQDAGTGNEVAAQDTLTVRARRTPKPLGAQTVGTSQATIAHGLGYAPTEVGIEMTSAGQVWRSAASDETNVYLTADAAGRTCVARVR